MKLLWTRRALNDIQHFIAQDSPAAAFRTTSDIMSRTTELLRANPMLGRLGRDSRTRELLLPPYIVVYRLREAIEIVAVIHGARDWPKDIDP